MFKLPVSLLLLAASIASALAAGSWQLSYTYSGDEQYSPCPGMSASLGSSKPYNEIPVNGSLFGAGFNGVSTIGFPDQFTLFRAQVQSLPSNTAPISALFETGFYNAPAPDGSWVDVQVNWTGAGAPPATATISFKGFAWAVRNHVIDAEGTMATVNFWVTDLLQETVSPTMFLQTPSLTSTTETQVRQVTGSIPLTINNGVGHYQVRFQARNRLKSPGNPLKPWSVLTDTRVYIQILP